MVVNFFGIIAFQPKIGKITLMIKRWIILFPLILFIGCAARPKVHFETLPDTYMVPAGFSELPGWNEEHFDRLLSLFQQNCRAKKTVQLYGDLCAKSSVADDSRSFFEANLMPYSLGSKADEGSGVMTGYYEPLLHGSRQKDERFRYPLLRVPDDLVTVELDTIYPELKGMRLRGKIEGRKLVPYYSRVDMPDANGSVICWVDDRVSLFFLEVQGSGRVLLDNNDTIFVGYADQNGHPYRSIGRHLVASGEIDEEAISLQSIRNWFEANPERVDEIIGHNPSYVFFRERSRPATGSLGIELTAERSIAVDSRFVPLGSMLFMQSSDPLSGEPLQKVVFAQDTGGAIKGEVRADYFWGYGPEALEKAGRMQEALELWIFMPKSSVTTQIR